MRVDKRKKKINLAGCYTLLFLCTAALVFLPFAAGNRSFVWYGDAHDGLVQHYNALAFYGSWLRQIGKNILNGNFSVPLWSFQLGFGGDIITTLHYYAIGDPLALTSFFVPERYTEYLYDALIILRLYLAGLSFLLYAEHYIKDRTALLASALIYTFSAFALFAAVRHPYFVNPMIYLPLLLSGADKILEKKAPGLFIAMVFLSAVSNFYFCYMLFFFTFFYVIFKFFIDYGKQWKKYLLTYVLQFIGYGCIGLLLSSCLLVPVLVLFFHDARTEAKSLVEAVYSLKYYSNYMTGFITAKTLGYYSYLGYGAVAGLCVLFAYQKRERQSRLFRWGFVGLTVMLCFPVFGYLLNGFSYVTNRWIWAYGFVVAMLTAYGWNYLGNLSKRENRILIAAMGIYAVLILGGKEAAGRAALAGLTLFGTAVAIHFYCCRKKVKKAGHIFLVFVILGIGANALQLYEFGGYKQEFVEAGQAYTKLNTTTDQILKSTVDDDSFYRKSETGSGVVLNSELQSGLCGIKYFWSLSNSRISEFLSELSNLEYSTYSFGGVDGRTSLETLAGVKYHITTQKTVPYGYELFQKQTRGGKDYYIYKNTNALPLGYTYDSYIGKEEFTEKNPVEKQAVMLTNVVLEHVPRTAAAGKMTAQTTSSGVEAECGEGVVYEQGIFRVKKSGAEVTLKFNPVQRGELYLWIPAFEYQRLDSGEKLPSKVTIQAVSGTVKKNVVHRTPTYARYNGRNSYAVNFGYSIKAREEIKLIFKQKGNYHLGDVEVISQKMEHYKNIVDELREEPLQNITLGVNVVHGTVEVSQPKILCLSIPYSDGWTAYVDGKKSELYPANLMFMALELEEGYHRIELRYCTPGLQEGMILTALGGILILILSGVRKRRKRR